MSISYGLAVIGTYRFPLISYSLSNSPPYTPPYNGPFFSQNLITLCLGEDSQILVISYLGCEWTQSGRLSSFIACCLCQFSWSSLTCAENDPNSEHFVTSLFFKSHELWSLPIKLKSASVSWLPTYDFPLVFSRNMCPSSMPFSDIRVEIWVSLNLSYPGYEKV